MERSLTDHAKKRLREIHALSERYNGRGDIPHAERLLELVGRHADELRELYAAGDEHFDVEAGDLLILCHELMIERGADPDGIMNTCYDRYKRKLTGLIRGGVEKDRVPGNKRLNRGGQA